MTDIAFLLKTRMALQQFADLGFIPMDDKMQVLIVRESLGHTR
jgi:hypothetical protein